MGLQLTDRCQAVCPKLDMSCSLVNKIVHVHKQIDVTHECLIRKDFERSQ